MSKKPAFTSPYVDGAMAGQTMSRDIAKAAATLSGTEARFLVDTYYTQQEARIRAEAQVRALSQSSEPNMVLGYLSQQAELMENQVKRALDKYTDEHPVGSWIKSLHGFGPVLSAGFIAHIDIEQAPTAGHIWSYAGLVDGKEWVSAADAAKWVKDNGLNLELAAQYFNRNIDSMRRMATQDRDGEPINMTARSLAAAISRRPWNASLKTLCFKAGECMVKFASHEDAFYGHLFRQRKTMEWERNLTGVFAQQAINDQDKYGNTTESYAWIQGMYHPDDIRQLIAAEKTMSPDVLKKIRREKGQGLPMLPPAQLHARARRFAVKIFLSHLHEVWYEKHFKRRVPVPFTIAHQGHVHRYQVPNYDSPYANGMPSVPWFELDQNKPKGQPS